MDADGVVDRGYESSPTVGAIALALSKAQGAMAAAKKDATNPHFKSRYADLASVWEACRVPLSANELAVIQVTEYAGTGGITLMTMLVHSSGEWFRSRLYVPLAQPSVQQIGSAITYARRYALGAIVGVAAADDDDGEAAETARPANDTKATPPAAPKRSEAQAARDMAELLKMAASPAEVQEVWARIERMPFKDAMRGELRGAYEQALGRWQAATG